MTRKERREKLKYSIKDILKSAYSAKHLYKDVKEFEKSTLSDYRKLKSYMHNIVSNDYFPEGRSRLYYAPKHKFSLNDIKEKYPRKYKQIMKEFKYLDFDYYEAKDYISGDNIFSKLEEKQNERRIVSGPNSKNVEKIIEEVENKHNLSLSYTVRDIIIKKQDEIFLNELKIYKKDIDLDAIATHNYTEAEVYEIAESVAKKEREKLKGTQQDKTKNVKEDLETGRQM